METNYRGLEDVQYIWHGEWADPELIYKGVSLNYHDVEDSLYIFYEDIKQSGETTLSFDEWFDENHAEAYDALDNLADEKLRLNSLELEMMVYTCELCGWFVKPLEDNDKNQTYLISYPLGKSTDDLLCVLDNSLKEDQYLQFYNEINDTWGVTDTPTVTRPEIEIKLINKLDETAKKISDCKGNGSLIDRLYQDMTSCRSKKQRQSLKELKKKESTILPPEKHEGKRSEEVL